VLPLSLLSLCIALATVSERHPQMLVAEIHGKYVLDARNFEDYLTSAVFGHLRYIKPSAFWGAQFDIAVSRPIEWSTVSANERIWQETGCSLSSFGALNALFWPNHKEGIPDLNLHFYGK
jgi:hypothetical protein